MDKFLRPERFEIEPSAPNADRAWKHWLKTFTNFIQTLSSEDTDKHALLVNFISPQIYDYIIDTSDYDDAVEKLQSLYIKPKNEIFARHVLATRKQGVHESLDEFVQVLKKLASECNYISVSAIQHQEEAIRDSFISGLHSNVIRQRLLEHDTLNLDNAVSKARSLEAAIKNTELYQSTDNVAPLNTINREVSPPPTPFPVNTVPVPVHTETDSNAQPTTAAVSKNKQSCFFCGNIRHRRTDCPARDSICRNCGKQGHFAKVCRSKAVKSNVSSIVCATPSSLSRAVSSITVNGKPTVALFDTGSSESFVSLTVAQALRLEIRSSRGRVTMAATDHTSEIVGTCQTTIAYKDNTYSNFQLSVLKSLCCDVILGLDFMRLHDSIEVKLGGERAPLIICGMSAFKVEPPSLFTSITSDCRPIACKSRRYSAEDRQFIDSEIDRLLTEGIIEPSHSPWRAQIVVTGDERKKRMVIDYSQTVNRYTLLDAYPLPRIEELVNKVAKYEYFSQLDLKSAYHQIPIRSEDKPLTAFEASGKLYQFCRIPFGVTNGVACFQRIMDDFIKRHELVGVYAYLDDITVCGKDQTEHDANLEKFFEAAAKDGLTFNDAKCKVSKTSIQLLGYVIKNRTLRPDPARLEALRQLQPPTNTHSLRRTLGLFAHYSRWISNFSHKIKPLSDVSSFPVPKDAMQAFSELKSDLERAVLYHIDERQPFVVETDASDVAIAATLSQSGRPVAFFSRSLNPSERKHSSVEKEAYAIIESIRRWRHYLAGRQFSLITDQKSVAFMFDIKHRSKIKNDKILRWRLELSSYSFDISYRKGKENLAADALSRNVCLSMDVNRLRDIHNRLCHPGVARMMHYIRVQNLPFSVEDVRRMTSRCHVCNSEKPRFYKPPEAHIIKATKPFERLDIDFKGPVPSSTPNKFFLTVVDEYSRFPFIFPCRDTSAQTAIECLNQLFILFGMPAFVHSDRGTAFTSTEFQTFLTERGVASSKTTRYNPQGNGLCERYNGIVWKAIVLALKSFGLPVSKWEAVLPQALHAIRSLLCTATNATPHERFFGFTRRTTTGNCVPTWLTTPGTVLLRRHARHSKYEPLVEQVDLLHATPNYAHIRFDNGRETTVSVRDLAPLGDSTSSVGIDSTPPSPEKNENGNDCIENCETQNDEKSSTLGDGAKYQMSDKVSEAASPTPYSLRRPSRQRNPPDRYQP